jgi:predicted GIY-YIG superfamily endonuclease
MPDHDDGPSIAWTIYTIHCPHTGKPFYVGQTLNFPRRVKDHLRVRQNASSAPRIKALLAENITPYFRILHKTETRKEADRLEMLEIQRHLSDGYALENAASELNAARKRRPQQ